MTSFPARNPLASFPTERPHPKQKRSLDEAERRAAKRFPMRLPIRYKGEAQSGVGQVVNISSGGVLFTTDGTQLPTGVLELSISWPVLLDEAVALNLVAVGPVVRTEAGKVAVRINKYEFRTTKAPAWKREAPLSDPRAHANALRSGAAVTYA
jgi:hypothetical protein